MKRGPSQLDRIAVGHVIYAFHDGGMERGLLNLINYGDRDHFHHVILCLTEAGAFAKLLESPSCTVVELHKRAGNDWRLPWRIAQVSRQHKLVVLHARGWPTLVETAIAARLAKVSATVYGFHGKTFEELQGIGLKRQWAQKAVIRSYRSIVTLNNPMRSDLARETGLPENRIQIIPNGVDVDAFRPYPERARIRARFDLPVDRFIIGNVARLDAVKNHEVVFRALACLPKPCVRPYFVIVGEGSHRLPLARQIQTLGVASDVRLFGYSDRIPELLNCMDLYVQSSFYEGFSNTILEAMACGLPILAGNVGGTSDLVASGREGFLFEPKDHDSLASLITRLQRDRLLLLDMGRRARERTVNFSVEKTVSLYESLYMSLHSIC
jgi:sugar transferase (PEP-CTERM/EpsH1 system associated)